VDVCSITATTKEQQQQRRAKAKGKRQTATPSIETTNNLSEGKTEDDYDSREFFARWETYDVHFISFIHIRVM
jgi:hypothetical protein